MKQRRSILDLFKKEKPIQTQTYSTFKELGSYQSYFSAFGCDIYSSDDVRTCIRTLSRHTSKANPKCSDKNIERLLSLNPNKYMNGKAMLEKLEWLGMIFSAEPHPSTLLIGDGKHEVLGEVDAQDSTKSFSITWTFQFSREMIKSEMEKNGFTFHEQPKKDTDFLLCGEKAWSKKEKAETLGIMIYDSRDEIVKTFPFLWNLRVEEKKIDNQKPNQPSQMSLF